MYTNPAHDRNERQSLPVKRESSLDQQPDQQKAEVDLALASFGFSARRATQDQGGSKILEHVFGGAEPNETPLLDRDYSRSDLRRACQNMVRRECFRDRHQHFPGQAVVERVMGAIALINPKTYRNFYRDLDGQQQFAFQEEANEKAFAYGVQKPMELLKAGKLGEALRSFQVALDAAPNRLAETYETLGSFSEMLYRLQRDLKAGLSTMKFEITDSSDHRVLNSSLATNVLELKKRPEHTSSEWYSTESVSSLYGCFVPSGSPTNWDKLEKSLLESNIPFREIGKEAFLKAAELMYAKHIETRGKTGTVYHEPLLEISKACWLAGNYKQAESVLERLENDDNVRSVFYNSTWTLKSEIMRDTGRFDEAIQVLGAALTEKYGVSYDRLNYEEVLKVCRLSVRESGGGEKEVWEKALPHFQRLVSKVEEDGPSWREHLPYVYLGLANYHTGQRGAAIGDFERALKILGFQFDSGYREIRERESRLKSEIEGYLDRANKA